MWYLKVRKLSFSMCLENNRTQKEKQQAIMQVEREGRRRRGKKATTQLYKRDAVATSKHKTFL